MQRQENVYELIRFPFQWIRGTRTSRPLLLLYLPVSFLFFSVVSDFHSTYRKSVSFDVVPCCCGRCSRHVLTVANDLHITCQHSAHDRFSVRRLATVASTTHCVAVANVTASNWIMICALIKQCASASSQTQYWTILAYCFGCCCCCCPDIRLFWHWHWL